MSLKLPAPHLDANTNQTLVGDQSAHALVVVCNAGVTLSKSERYGYASDEIERFTLCNAVTL
jgi:hypothetical protein